MMNKILASLGGIIIMMYFWWASGTDFPTERGSDLVVFLIIIPLSAFLGLGLYMLVWGIDHD